MPKNILFTLGFCFAVLAASAQKIDVDTLAALPRELREISGMARTQKGNIWAVNDSGNKPYLYQIDSKGNVIRAVYIANAPNVDWEELTADPKGNIYIGDCGNNRNDRKDLAIYIVSEEQLLKKDTVTSEKIAFSYSDQTAFPATKDKMNYDIEAIIFQYNSLFLFSKNRTDPFTKYTTVYELPAAPGTYIANKVDSIFLGDGPKELYQITAADISEDGNRLVLMSYEKMYIMHDFPYRDFNGGRMQMLEFNNLSQKESVVFANDSTLYISDEKSVLGGGNLYSLNISAQIKANNLVRKNEVNLPSKGFSDSLLVTLDTEVRGKVFYEFFDVNGERIDAGTVGYFPRGNASFKLAPPMFQNGTYLLNIQVGKRPHAFFVYRFNPVDWEKVKKEFEDFKK